MTDAPTARRLTEIERMTLRALDAEARLAAVAVQEAKQKAKAASDALTAYVRGLSLPAGVEPVRSGEDVVLVPERNGTAEHPK